MDLTRLVPPPESAGPVLSAHLRPREILVLLEATETHDHALRSAEEAAEMAARRRAVNAAELAAEWRAQRIALGHVRARLAWLAAPYAVDDHALRAAIEEAGVRLPGGEQC